jgi:hypothetical protein
MSISNPFADLTVFLPPLVMQVYVGLMALAVAIGTLFDMVQKRRSYGDFWCTAGLEGVGVSG